MDAHDLEGRTAVVTGATSGIGREIARTLSARGATLVVAGRRTDRLETLVEEIRGRGGRAEGVVGDVRDTAHAAETVARAASISASGGLEILVNNAGVIGSGPLETTSTEEWDRLLDIDLKAPFLWSRAALPHMKDRPGAAIVNVSSVAGRRPYATIGPYCVAKAGLDMLTQCLALEGAPHGIRVNAINPGVIVSELHQASSAVDDYDAFLARSRETHPLGRVGTPEDAARLVAFLVSDDASWITGGLIPLDGGRALTSLR